ncbi:MAG: hypothetical protein M3159_07915 [Actinomycetota bacterium]|nr:hypothetical protein [Actinomycetota bacterium]
MRRFLALASLATILPAGLVLTSCSGGGAKGAGGTTPTSAATSVVPGPGQAFVTGVVRRFTADDAQISGPLPTPFTISALERGSGNATIENALVDGKRSTISWATGTPLPISGAGGLDLGAVHVDIDGAGATWLLDGAARNFVPGSYRAEAPVAVGNLGIAAPRDSVAFDADDRTVITTRGGVVVHVSPQRVQLEGPGTLKITGQLQVQTPGAKRAAGSVTFNLGPFTATLIPTGTGVRVDSVLQGPITTG